MTQDMKKEMVLHSIDKRLVRNGRTTVRTAAYSSTLTCVQRLFAYIRMNTMKKNMLHIIDNLVMNTLKSAFCGKWTRLRYAFVLLMMVVGVGDMWGQTPPPVDYSGTYYIAFAGKSGNNYAPDNQASNYYLCPTESWCWYQATDDFTNEENGQPFLTTHKITSETESKYKWIVKKHIKDGKDYYSFRYGEDYEGNSRYLLFSGIIRTAGENRVRVHIEKVTYSDIPDDNALFEITTNKNGGYKIRPLNKEGYWINVTNGNYDNFVGNSGKDGGPTGHNLVSGTIGIWNEENFEARCYFEDVITRPMITINSSNKIVITAAQTGDVTIKYTTDGSDPASNGTTYNEPINPSVGTTIKAVAIVSGKVSNVATLQRRLIQNQNDGWNDNTDFHFYMTQGDDASSITKVNTTSLFRPSMEWYIIDNKNCFNYIVNASNNKYLCYDGTNKVYMAAYDNANDNKYKFSISESQTAGIFNIYSDGQNKLINKANGNNSGDVIATLDYSETNANNGTARWKFVLPSDLDTTLPFTTDNHYYQIGSVADATYVVTPPTGTNTNVMTTNYLTPRNTRWYFVEQSVTPADNWTKYYCIVNAETGQYMFFDKEVSTDNQDKAIVMKPAPETVTDNYLFVIAKTVTDGQCYIVPKPLKDLKYNTYTAFWRENANAIQTRNNRADSKMKWTFTEDEKFVHAPIVTVSGDNSSATLSSPQDGVTLYYILGSYDENGVEPDDPTTSLTPYVANTPIPLTDKKRNVIKVIAAKTVESTTYTSTIVKQVVDRRDDTSGDYTGYFYLQNQGNTAFNMYPTNANESSTIKTDQKKDLSAVWHIVKQPGTGGHNIIHFSDGKYMTATDATALTNTVTLTMPNPADVTENKYLFVIEETETTGVYNIKPIASSNTDDKNYLNPTGGNGSNHTIGLWTATDGNSKWKLINKIPAAPTIAVSDINVTITPTFGDVWYKVDNQDYDGDDATDPAVNDGTNGTNISLQYGPSYQVKAISAYQYDGINYWVSDVVTKDVQVNLTNPTISVAGNQVTIFSTQSGGVSYKYTIDTDGSSDPKASGTTGTSFTISEVGSYYVKAVAYNTVDGTTYWSEVVTRRVNQKTQVEISSLSAIDDASGNYRLASNFTASGTPQNNIGSTEDNPFTGIIDGQMQTISSTRGPLFNYVKDATIKNVIIGTATIESGTDVGSVAGVAQGDTRIYNCGVLSGTINGSGKVGGIVGSLEGNSRVINCFSYANIITGANCGGIVGYNNVATISSDIAVGNGTMVMNCMFYGNITGSNPAPIYGGEIIHNKYSSDTNTGLNNYNYYLYKDQSFLSSVDTYNKARGALGAEERYLNRFEFFRLTLNSTRNLAAFYVSGDATQKDIMAKWVLDKSVAPYPILKVQDYYPSIINPDADNAVQINLTDETDRNKGRKLGSLTLYIQLDDKTDDSVPFHFPSGAGISTPSKPLNVTDKDYINNNFNYKKIQLPYYSEVGTGNYTGNRVVTGWKIVKINGNTTGSGTFTNSGTEVTFGTSGNITSTPFNFVDRECTNKDIYSVSNRVFNQGAYWEVPDGVTSITIEPYWAKAVYLSDTNYDVTYDGGTKYGITVAGAFSKPTALGDQAVYNTVSDAWSNLGSNASYTIYDYAIVLVGNYHYYSASAAIINDGSNKPVTFMSADLDGDCEPDNTLFYYHNNRQQISPVRFDFLNIPGIGTVKRTWDSGMSPQPGIFKPKGWFEITNTVVVRFGQFEYANNLKTIMSPLILQGGIYEQIVSGQGTAPRNTSYILVGGNAWFNTFANGCHTETFFHTPKVPINVTGGEYNKFYLSGIYQASGTPTTESAECYIDGGKFEEVAGSGMQKIDGDVTWLVNGADITKFFGGGINAAQSITGNIRTIISNSYVDEFYGGPKFGEVTSGKIVKTKADDCHFGKFYGAGYGGTAFNRVDAENYQVPATENTVTWSSYVTTHYKRKYDSGNSGISTNYEYEYILHSDGSRTVARFFVNYASLSLASTRDVTSDLTGCTIGTFFGGGRLGAVNGDVNSTLTDCHVTGNVFGAGFSAEAPKVEVWPIENMNPEPEYNRVAGVFNDASVQTPTGVEYTWKHAESVSAGSEFNETDGHYILTTVNLDGLGAVNGNATLNLKGGTIIDGNVYGGGDSSPVNGSTTVNILE